MLEKITCLSIGGGSLGIMQVVDSIQLPSTQDTEIVVKLILNIIVTLATLVGLFRKKQPLTNK